MAVLSVPTTTLRDGLLSSTQIATSRAPPRFGTGSVSRAAVTGGSPATTAETADVLGAEPAAFVTVTSARSVLPVSAALTG